MTNLFESLFRLACLGGAGYLIGGWRISVAVILIAFVVAGLIQDHIDAMVKCTNVLLKKLDK